MRVAVLGAGIVGVTTAYELVAEGHEVTVLERRGSVASEASFAGAGLVAPGWIATWNSPGNLPRAGGRGEAALHGQLAVLLAQAPWLWRWWRAGRTAVHGQHRAALWRLADLSRRRLQALTQRLNLDLEQREGCTVLLRGDPELAQSRGALKLLAELGISFELLDAERTRAIEPGLSAQTALRAAVHLREDSVGNCRQFAQLLKAESQRLGADFRLDTAVLSVEAGNAPTVVTPAGRESFDAVVVCTGADAAALLRPLGLKLPLLPVYGHSVTAPLRHLDGHGDLGPRAAVVDARSRVVISRLGQRVRVAGGAELGGRADRFHEGVLARLYAVLDDWFPGAAVMAQAQRWKGARPMLPDGLPVLGASGAPGVWLNLGHGGSGWALACGSARALAEQVAGRPAPLDVAPFGVERLRR